ncbi:pentapeptide repeat-containing protein [Nitrosomonas sp.]|uniref:pentapeptide repeat-containing protein n=1 Tax=Nitrosomonas sp. TaxID=42353 RepID=UPI001D86233B|nr:pentapeptide repeat-containing protein [Nitrosomonas sp.]MCB1949934.1 pentapeptide repeat-containing protein [Nitrosomonas sp.]
MKIKREIIDEDLVDRYKEVALSVRRTMFVLITFSVFCLSVLFVPDEYLIRELGKSIDSPFLGLSLPVDAFIFVAPVFLLIITAYMNVFLAELGKMHNLPDQKRFPILLTLEGGNIAFLRNYLSSGGNIVLLMILYCWFISPHPNAPYFFGFTCFVILKAFYERKTKLLYLRFNYTLFAVILILSAVILSMNINRGYDLDRTIIHEKTNLSGLNFSNVSFQYSDFENVSLKKVKFQHAKLTGSNFKGADLVSANLILANLQNANLENANLSNANLENAILIGANLKNAKLNGALLRGANFSDADLSGADMEGSIFLKRKLFDKGIKNESKYNIVGLNCSQVKSSKNMLEDITREICR